MIDNSIITNIGNFFFVAPTQEAVGGPYDALSLGNIIPSIFEVGMQHQKFHKTIIRMQIGKNPKLCHFTYFGKPQKNMATKAFTPPPRLSGH